MFGIGFYLFISILLLYTCVIALYLLRETELACLP